jgi:hypothetical protein
MKIREKKGLISFIPSAGITIWPFGIWLNKRNMSDAEDVNHERIHEAQQRELLLVLFVLIYFAEWGGRYLILLWEKHVKKQAVDFHSAYRSISFENEAYSNQINQKYLSSRKHYTWMKYS